ncbi:hypothetical protein F751_0853 [Auxenochlorella protothecoides]|uniref:Uncharacterized protein n=1 Tax=Auxenochlorella protothecoides TaxID=3075 RepID=A0A087SPE0_AUXPR|nr:hypothetical protein F751_0853 [Auxenochlorella protothecoides]KFM27594.1 hypothetical protein F751_0853 [Auxenochlorella protothecoides]
MLAPAVMMSSSASHTWEGVGWGGRVSERERRSTSPTPPTNCGSFPSIESKPQFSPCPRR